MCESSSIPVEADAEHSIVSERCDEEVNVLPTLAEGGQGTLVQGDLPNPVGNKQNNYIAMILIFYRVFHAWLPPDSLWSYVGLRGEGRVISNMNNDAYNSMFLMKGGHRIFKLWSAILRHSPLTMLIVNCPIITELQSAHA